MTRSQALIGFYLPVSYQRPDLVTRALRFLVDALGIGVITSTLDTVLPLADAAHAHRRLENRDVHGVIALDPRDETPSP